MSEEIINKAQEHFLWIQGIIKSCNTTFHFKAADNLVALFRKQFPDEYDMWVMLEDMKIEAHEKACPSYEDC